MVVGASESARIVAGCSAVTLEQGECRCVCIAGLGELGARVVQVGLCAHECIGCTLRTTLGLIECALGDATRTDTHARRGETIAVTGDDHHLGVRHRCIECVRPGLHEHHAREQHVQQSIHLHLVRAGLGAHVGAQALTLVHDRGERDGGDRIQREHRADAPRLAQLLQRAPGGIHVLGDDPGQRIPERNLHCHAAIRVDVDQVVQGAECALDLAQRGGRGGVHVECERECLGASRRRGRIRLGGGKECECCIARRFCGGACGVGLHEAQRQIGLVAHVGVDGDAQTIDVFVQSAHLGGQFVHLLSRGARLFECVGCFSTDHRVGIDAGDRCELFVHLGEVLAQLRALGLERGDDAGVHQLPTIALDGATTLGEHGEQSLGTTTQLFDAHEFIVHARVSACGQLRFGCHHGGIQARQLGAQ